MSPQLEDIYLAESGFVRARYDSILDGPIRCAGKRVSAVRLSDECAENYSSMTLAHIQGENTDMRIYCVHKTRFLYVFVNSVCLLKLPTLYVFPSDKATPRKCIARMYGK